jgi:hypothetical protein
LYDESGAVTGLYGRSIKEDGGISHLYLPGKRRGLINRQAVKRSQVIILTEAVIDALSLWVRIFYDEPKKRKNNKITANPSDTLVENRRISSGSEDMWSLF